MVLFAHFSAAVDARPLEHAKCGSDTGVEIACFSGHGNLDEFIAVFRRKGGDALPFRPYDQDEPLGQRSAPDRLTGLVVKADDPEILFLQQSERTADIDDLRNRQTKGRARAGLDDGTVNEGGTIVLRNDAQRTSNLSRADDGSKVVRVLTVIKQYDQRRGARRHGSGDLVKVSRRDRLHAGGDALMDRAVGDPIKLIARYERKLRVGISAQPRDRLAKITCRALGE